MPQLWVCVLQKPLHHPQVIFQALQSREVQVAQIGPPFVHQACQQAECRLLRNIHQDHARHKRHALTIPDLQRQCIINPWAI